MKRIIIPLEDFPEEGMLLTGELESEVFGLDCEDAQSAAPVEYRLDVQLYDTELLVRGSVSAPFRLRCTRCLKQFDYCIELDDLSYSYDTAGKAFVDVTEDVREDILLELPGHPKCELAGQECELFAEFGDFRLDKDPQPGVDCATPSGESVWDALDQFPGTQK